MGYKMKGSSFYGHGNQHKGSPAPFLGAVIGAASKVANVAGKVKKGVDTVKSVFSKKKEEASPNKYKSPAKAGLTKKQKLQKKYVDLRKKHEDTPGFKEARDKAFGGKTTVKGKVSSTTTPKKEKAPGKFLLTAAKVVGKGLMGRSKQKDARDAAINEGVQKAMSRKL